MARLLPAKGPAGRAQTSTARAGNIEVARALVQRMDTAATHAAISTARVANIEVAHALVQ